MKIAILSCFYPFRGGISQFNSSLLKELKKENEVIAYNFKRQYPSILFPGKTQYVSEKDNAVPVESIVLLDTANPFNWRSSAKEILKSEPDLLIMRYWMSYFAPSQGRVARYIRKHSKCKVISINDNIIPHEPKFFDKTLTRWYLKSLDGSILLSDAVKRDQLKILPGSKYIVSQHPSYDHFGEKVKKSDALKSLNLAPEKKTLLFFGLIREYKGLDILIEAFSELDDSYQLVIAGEPYGSFGKYQELIDISPNRENIHLFTNYISDDDVPVFFSAADVCVLPYRSATQSGISAIAYHFELPMITTGVGALNEDIGDTGTGIIVDEITPEGVKRGIVDFFSAPGICTNIIHNIRKERARLSWSNFCSKLTDFYKTL